MRKKSFQNILSKNPYVRVEEETANNKKSKTNC